MDATTKYSRRDFGKLALAGLPASALITGWQPGGAQTITSRIKGIQVGAITYSFNRLPGGPEAIIQAYRTIGLAEMELMSNHAETLAGAPTAAQGGGRRGSLTP